MTVATLSWRHRDSASANISTRRPVTCRAANFDGRSWPPSWCGGPPAGSPASHIQGFRPRVPGGAPQVFRDLASDGSAVVITGHEVPFLLDVAHHVSWCTSGTTYELGLPAEATRHEAFRREYLGPWS